MLNFITQLFGTANDRYVKDARARVTAINSLEASLKKYSDEELRGQTVKFRERLDKGEQLDSLLVEAFATAREGGIRALGMRHYDVQLIGGMVLHEGTIAEMKTGEGKTLVATLALYLNALAGDGAHLITVNDYLAQRDAAWMGKLYNFLGLSVGTIISDLSDAERKRAYGSDITYGTNNEFGFDYLRDNMKYRLSDYVQRKLKFAIVDEVDSILVDEARTPLIISGKADMDTALYFDINKIIPYLKRDEDYLVDEEHRSTTLTDSGIEKIEERMAIANLYDPTNIEVVHHVNKCLQAHTLYKKDDQYIVREGEVIIVDEFTGRPMQGRRWSDGLHQAIEAKEGLEIKDENQTLATVTFQNYFRMYEKLAGMTGTAETEAEEFHEIYKLEVVVIPTNRPIQRLDQEDVVFRSYREKFNAIVEQILLCNAKEQPVLVGTTSVEKSEAISQVLKKKGIAHEVLNAKQHGREAHIVAQAGRKSAVTIATNMAGRGTDILLGGNPEFLTEEILGKPEVPEFTPENERANYLSDEYKVLFETMRKQCVTEKEQVLAAGGLFIIGTERHESRRIDNQLRGRAGRQGDPGESRFFLSLEDDLLRLFGADRIGKIMDTLRMEDGVPIEHRMVTRSIEGAQKKVEARNFEIRKNILEYDDVMDVQRKSIYTLRRNVLRGHDEKKRTLLPMVLDQFEEVAVATLDTYAARVVRHDDWDISGLTAALEQVFNLRVDLESITGRDAIEMYVWNSITKMVDEKGEMFDKIAERLNERRAQLQAEADAVGEDGEATRAAVADIDLVSGRELFEEQIQSRYLASIDRFWRQHLLAMDQLRDGIGMRGYAQKDPKQEYKKEGYTLFVDLMLSIKTNIVEFVSKVQVETPASLEAVPQHNVPKQIHFNRPGVQEVAAQQQEEDTFKRDLPKVGRNDLCHCGSGKKYKNCCMRKEAAASW
ncbi:MAG: preprotein translocase subunit SecA [Bradymonadaceae bacterium]|nr:preprotein translocase subunit SecA [Lujinxingiaceae bacterium]